jgi:hypothetical protein
MKIVRSLVGSAAIATAAIALGTARSNAAVPSSGFDPTRPDPLVRNRARDGV